MIIRRVINPLSCLLWREGAKEPGSQWLFAPVYAFEVELVLFSDSIHNEDGAIARSAEQRKTVYAFLITKCLLIQGMKLG